MARIEVEVTATTVPYERGGDGPGVCVECTECGHKVNVAGETRRSYRRGYAKLKEECPEGGSNYYACEDEPEND